jgi:hypothetical protein
MNVRFGSLADICSAKRPLHRKRTCAVQWLMSAMDQKRTLADLFDHFVCAQKKGFRDCKAERFGRFQVDNQFKLGRLDDR